MNILRLFAESFVKGLGKTVATLSICGLVMSTMGFNLDSVITTGKNKRFDLETE